jgi:hypothetical protein
MCVVGGAATVGRCLALKRVLRRRFYLGLEYHVALINTLANVGNPEALFQSGSRHAVLGNTHGVIMPCLDQLRRAAEVGHKESMYALSLFLYRPNSGEANDDEARWLLRLVEGPQEGGDGASLENFDLYKTPLKDHCVNVGLPADGCDCRVAGAGTCTSPRRFAVCGSRVWRPHRMACLVLVA